MSDCSMNAWRVPELPVNGYGHDQMERMCAGKKSYPSRRVAKRWAKMRGLSVYRCRICGCYHLTSQRHREAPKDGSSRPCQEPAKSGAGASGCDARGSAGQEAESGEEPAASIKEQVIL